MKQIALYGKGVSVIHHISKSFRSPGKPWSFSYADWCDPKRDKPGCYERDTCPTVLDLIRERGEENLTLDDVVFTG